MSINNKPEKDESSKGRRVYLVDQVIDNKGSHYETHYHQPGNLGMLLQGPTPNGLMVDRAQMRLCSTCHLVYWEQLEQVLPKSIIER